MPNSNTKAEVISRLNDILDFVNEQEVKDDVMECLVIIGNVKLALLYSDDVCIRVFIEQYLMKFMAGLAMYCPEKFKNKSLLANSNSSLDKEDRKKIAEAQNNFERLFNLDVKPETESD